MFYNYFASGFSCIISTTKSAAESTKASTKSHIVKVDHVDCTWGFKPRTSAYMAKVPDLDRGRGGVDEKKSLGRFAPVLDDLWR
eukprot:scaffold172912_cov36-Cyclotella_meneghiniana.AAC.1